MRIAGFIEAASKSYEVHVGVVPVAGSLPGEQPADSAPVTVVGRPDARQLRLQLAELIADPQWRSLLQRAEPMLARAQAASPAMARDVVRATGVVAGTAVHVVRSYLAPLGLAVAQQLAAPWATLDLDDDDEALASDDETAAGYRRLVATFAPEFSMVSLASELDAESVGRRHGWRAMTVANAVKVRAFHGERPGSDTVLFVGNLTYEPNVEAAAVLVEQVLPSLTALLARPVEVILVGDYLASGPIGVMSRNPAVTVTGYVGDLEPFYHRADVVVAPLSRGSGTRFKLLEAFAHGVPVVSTPAGAAGLDVRHGEHLLIAATTTDLARRTAAILNDAALSLRLATAASEFVGRCHGPEALQRQVEELLCEARRVGPTRS